MKLFRYILLLAMIPASTLCAPTTLQTEYKKQALAAKKSYEALIEPSKRSGKDKKIKELEMLAALVMQQATLHIMRILEEQLGKESIAYKDANSYANNLRKSLDQFIPNLFKIPKSITAAQQWVTGDLALDKNTETFVERTRATLRTMSMNLKDHGTKIPNTELAVLLDKELDALNMRYQPLIKTLKQMGKATFLPDDFTSLRSLYKAALSASVELTTQQRSKP